MKRLIALLLCLMVCLSAISAPAYAADNKLPFEAGTKGTFFAPVFGPTYDGFNNITSLKAEVDADKIDEQGVKAVAKEMSSQLKNMPEGRRVIQLHAHLTAKYLDDPLAGGFIVNPVSVENLRKQIDELFKELKALDTPIDVIYDDMEAWPTIYGLENNAIANFRQPGEDIVTSYTAHGHLYEDWIKDELLKIEESSEYQNILKPELEKRGFVFGDDYDLKYINIFPGAIEPRKTRFYESNPPEGADVSYVIFNNVIGDLAKRDGYGKAVADPIMEHYPDVLFSNWRCHGTSGEMDIYDFNGNLNVAVGDAALEHTVGPQANWVFYGCYKGWGGWIENNPPRNWRYDTFQMQGFNELKVDYIELADAALSNKKNDYEVSIWISNKEYSYDGTEYYAEAIYHGGMFNPQPFLFWPGGSSDMGSDLGHLQELLEQLDELIGHEDRKTLMTDSKYVAQWDDRYILSGIYAGGKNVWRITPDLFTAGVTTENFLVKENPPTFRIGNQNVEFPSGSYIYYPENDPSEYGYWVISPEGTRPREWRDDKNPMPGPQIPMGTDGSPLGYMHEAATEMPDELDLSRSKEYKAPTTTEPVPDEGETDAPPVTDVTVQTLNLNPMRGSDENIPVFLGKLPADAQNHWAKHTLSHMLALGVMQGTEKGMEPDEYISRAEFLAMLERILGAGEMEFTGEIADVKAEDWYATVMQTAVSGGWIDLDVVTGKANPDAKITRAEMCTIMVKALGLTEAAAADFTDNDSMTTKVKSDVGKVANAGLILGYQDGSFRPLGVLTRAETACLFERLIKQIPKLFPAE